MCPKDDRMGTYTRRTPNACLQEARLPVTFVLSCAMERRVPLEVGKLGKANEDVPEQSRG